MSAKKRLFLFAAYDPDGIVDDALIYYVSALAQYGDVILCMDNDCKNTEIKKLKPYTVAIQSKRHGEYDFGSYKRAFQYAYDNDLLKNYDFIYLVNDSVFGPMFNPHKLINQMEHVSTDAVGIIESRHKTHKFMESWFVQLNKKIFMSKWFYEFISSVQKEKAKSAITVKYEHGLTNIIQQNNCSWIGIYPIHGRTTYNHPKRLFKMGCPFVKKASFTRHNGALGKQILYILKHSDNIANQYVMASANRLYGEKYMQDFLTSNPLKILWRNIQYGITKLKNGKI